MKYSVAAVLAVATGAMANNVTVVTEVVDVYTTFCPAPTTITHGSSTYTVTEPTTLTITDCPCTITKPVIPTSSVICNTCTTGYANSTVPAPTGGVPTTPGSPESPTSPGETPAVPTAGAAKIAGLSGLAGLAGVAAFFL